MEWPWAFLEHDPSQAALRRIVLDHFANIAQISVVVPLILLQLGFLLAGLQQRSARHSSVDTPSSPAVKKAKGSSSFKNLAIAVRRWIWWLGGEASLFGQSLGTRGEVLGCIAWTTWLLLLTVSQTGDDYLHLTKRFGIIAASQLPLHYLLAIKTPYSPLQYLTRASHETLNTIHQLLGRIITAFLYAHVALYLNFYVQKDLLASKLQEAYVICGVVGIILFTLVGTSSLAPVRKWSYRVFLGIHISLSVILLPILFFHVSHIRIYIYEAVVILIVNIGLRAVAANRFSNATLHLLPGSNLVEVTIPLANAQCTKWQAGQHAYISLPGKALRAALAKNPFTVSSLPAIDKELRFVARVQSGNTVVLAGNAKSGQSSPRQLLVEGPYGLATHSDTLLSYDRVLLIAGGIGATFIMPLYRQLLCDLSPTRGSYRRQKVSAIWIARTAADTAWATPREPAERAGFEERLTIYLTGKVDSAEQNREAGAEKLAVHDDEIHDDDHEDGIELEERANLLPASSSSGHLAEQPSFISGRPRIAQLVDQAFSNSASERIAIVVCGPKTLGHAVRDEVERWVYKGRDAWFWNESFSL